MAEVVLFHHVQGLTAGCVAFADDLRAAGHTVHTPDIFEGHTFATLDEGMAHVKGIGFDVALQRWQAAAASLPDEVVYAGFSLGVMAAQMLAQTRPGAKGAVLMHAAFAVEEFGEAWPAGVALQLHSMTDDGWGDVDVARELAATVEGAELYEYPGDRHVFTDRSLPDHEPGAAALVGQRVLAFLDRIG